MPALKDTVNVRHNPMRMAPISGWLDPMFSLASNPDRNHVSSPALPRCFSFLQKKNGRRIAKKVRTGEKALSPCGRHRTGRHRPDDPLYYVGDNRLLPDAGDAR